MRSLLNLAMLAALLCGGMYFFFRDAVFVADLLSPSLGKVPADESLRQALLRRIYIALGEGDSATAEMIAAVYYPEALAGKFRALADGDAVITRARYAEEKEKEFAAYVRAALDKDGSGAVERGERPPAEAARLDVLDANADGILSFDELREKGRQEALAAFAAADRNGDSQLSEEEYAAARGGDAAVRAFIAAMDSNINDVIDLEELTRAQHAAARHWQP